MSTLVAGAELDRLSLSPADDFAITSLSETISTLNGLHVHIVEYLDRRPGRTLDTSSHRTSARL